VTKPTGFPARVVRGQVPPFPREPSGTVCKCQQQKKSMVLRRNIAPPRDVGSCDVGNHRVHIRARFPFFPVVVQHAAHDSNFFFGKWLNPESVRQRQVHVVLLVVGVQTNGQLDGVQRRPPGNPVCCARKQTPTNRGRRLFRRQFADGHRARHATVHANVRATRPA